MCQDRQGRSRFMRSIVPSACLALIAACSGNSKTSSDVGAPGGSGPELPRATYESDDPTHLADQNATLDAGEASNQAPSAGAVTGDNQAKGATTAERAIAEADIIHVEGDRLYALSEYGGLSVIDISVPENLRMLGRYALRARPFEMYVRAGVAYAMYSSFPEWTEEKDGYWKYHVTSKLVAFKVDDPKAIKEIGSFALPGEVSDSRMVGDVIYVASYENGNCWRCAEGAPRTTVTSIAIGDPAALHTVDQLTFDDPQGSYGWYRRSISVNTSRMYVSGMIYDNFWGSGTGHSTIQVVDISDPAGDLKTGAAIPVTGSIENRWEMDELDGVLRVISQSGSAWSNGPAPTVETFKVTSATEVTPLGKLTMTLPKTENLKSVRFDGTRGYAVTFEQKDPLFTLDLTDPANPKQVGELEMPGYLYYMEPRGDRMIALGMDNGNASGGLTVSIFDVANLAKPALLQRANFGGEWGWTPEDQDRIHKAFKIFDAQGLIAMPFAGYTNDGDGCGTYVSGVQLLDFTRDTVTKRGVASIRGSAQRAFLHRDRLYAMSDDQVASFNIDNRDAPTRLGTVALANMAEQAVRVGTNIVALGSDWYTQSPQIVVVPLAGASAEAASNALPIATIDLGATVAGQDDCSYRYWSSFSSNSELFVNGNLVYVVYNGTFANRKGEVGFAVIDLTDPAHPVLAGHKLLPIGSQAPLPTTRYGYYYDGYGFGIGYYYSPNGLYASGKRIVQSGSTVALQELVPAATTTEPQDPYNTYPDARTTLHAVDLSDPANIRLVSSTPMGAGPSSSGLFADGSLVLSSHFESSADRPGKLRFYVDQVDLSTPTAPAQTSISVPGSLFGVDQGAKRIVTVDYSRTSESIASDGGAYSSYYESCRPTTAFGTSWMVYHRTWVDAGAYYRSDYPEACVRVDRSLKLLDLNGGTATLLDTFVPTGPQIQSATMGSDRIILTGYDNTSSRTTSTTSILSGIRSGKLTQASTITTNGYTTPIIDGMRVAFSPYWSDPVLTVYDLQDAANPTKILETKDAGAPYGGVSSIELDPQYVILSLGQYGVSAVPLP